LAVGDAIEFPSQTTMNEQHFEHLARQNPSRMEFFKKLRDFQYLTGWLQSHDKSQPLESCQHERPRSFDSQRWTLLPSFICSPLETNAMKKRSRREYDE
jgi:hypothetical protein